VFSAVGGAIQSSFGKSSVLRAALDAALNPAVAGAPNNRGIMSAVYNAIVDPIKKALPPQLDLSNATQRGGVVDNIIKTAGDKFSNGSGGGATSSLDGDTSFLNGASHALSAPFLNGFSSAMVIGFWVSLAVIAIAFILSFFLKATPLRAKSALQEVADADAAILATRAAEMVGAPLEPSLSTQRNDVVDETRGS
jgi:hypothetical protein